MAKLAVLPEQAIISGFKGKVDFYLWKGLPVARAWPRSPGHVRAPAVEAQWPIFSYAAKAWATLSDEVQSTYRTLASASGMTGRDLFTRSVIKGLYRYPLKETMEMKLIWLSSQPQVMQDLNRSATLDWTDLDLSAKVSANATVCIFRVHGHLDAIAAGMGNRMDFQLREKGAAAPKPSTWTLDGAGVAAGSDPYEMLTCGINSDKILQYRIALGGTITIDTWIDLLGYFEIWP